MQNNFFRRTQAALWLVFGITAAAATVINLSGAIRGNASFAWHLYPILLFSYVLFNEHLTHRERVRVRQTFRKVKWQVAKAMVSLSRSVRGLPDLFKKNTTHYNQRAINYGKDIITNH